MSNDALRLVGNLGSPYSRKMRAVLRYRRIPFRWIRRGSREDEGIPPVKVSLIPVLVYPARDGGEAEAMIDSTPMIRRLEREVEGRAVVPPDRALALLDALIEDYADEWVTKQMFHYRWHYAADIDKAGTLLPLQRQIDMSPAEHAELKRTFIERQVERLWVVGSNETTAPVIESSYRRLLAVLEAIFSTRSFVMGERPGAADFGLFGQLSQLALFDPTPEAIALAEAARVVAWVSHVDDLGGLELADDGWLDPRKAAAALRPLLEEIGRVYAPFLLANGRALTEGAERVECTIDDRAWVQRPFPYQGKCLKQLREQYGELDAEDRRRVDQALDGTGCEALFA